MENAIGQYMNGYSFSILIYSDFSNTVTNTAISLKKTDFIRHSTTLQQKLFDVSGTEIQRGAQGQGSTLLVTDKQQGNWR